MSIKCVYVKTVRSKCWYLKVAYSGGRGGGESNYFKVKLLGSRDQFNI